MKTFSLGNFLTNDINRRRVSWIRVLIALGVVFVSAYIAFNSTESEMTLYLIVMVGVTAVLVFLRWPTLGILLAVISGLIIPWSGPSGFNASIGLIALLFGLWIMELITDRDNFRIHRSRTFLPAVLFMVVAVLSLGVGQLNWYTFAETAPFEAQAAGLAIYILSMAAFLLAAQRIGNLQWLKWMTWIYLTVATIVLIIRIIPALGSIFAPYLAPPGAVFWIWFSSLAFSQALLNRKLHPLLRVFLFLLTALVIYHMYFQRFTNKSGWVTIFIALGGIIGARSIKRTILIVAIGLLALGFLNLASTSIQSEEYSLSTRIEAGVILIEMMKVNPFLGLGFGNYYWFAPLFSIRGFDVVFSSHNNYIDVAAQTGIIGLLIFIWLFAEIARLLVSLRDRVPTGGFSEAFLYAAIGGISGMVAAAMLADWVLPFFYNIGMNGFRHSVIGWLFLGGVLVLARLYPNPIPKGQGS